MHRHQPRKDELLTVIFQKQINQFFEQTKNKLGIDFFGMAERTPYGSMFASSDPGIATLLYDNDWYSIDPAINRDALKPINTLSPSIHKKYQEILSAKEQQCNQAGNFTIPIIQGETELYFCIAAQTKEKLDSLKKIQQTLVNVGMEFRAHMHLLANPAFELKKEFRECYFYYIVDSVAYEGKETYLASDQSHKTAELARFQQRANRIFRLTGNDFIGFTSDSTSINEYQLSGLNVEELIVIKNNLFLEYEGSIYYPEGLTHQNKKTHASSPAPTSILSLLSPQQKKCLELLAVGYHVKQIADKLQLSPRTVEHYLERIRKITASRNSKELISIYYQSL